MSRESRHQNPLQGTTNDAVNNQRHPSEEAIRSRAYEKFCTRNGAAGDEVTDWMDAERELMQECRQHPHKSN